MIVAKNKNFLFYLILILIPFLFFILLEVSLNLFNYGSNLDTWITVKDTHYALNPEIAGRYFTKVKSIPEPIQDVFEIEKSDSTFRVFVLGGSSAAGFPYMPLGSFSRYIRKRLELNYPSKKIEVVNLGLSAVNTYTILDLIPDVLEERPDVILIYAGHNEYYGALGVGSIESIGGSKWLIKLITKLNKYKTIQFLRNLISDLSSVFVSQNEIVSGTLMSRMARNQSIEIESEIYNDGLRQFEDNLIEIFNLVKEENTPLLLSTLVSNLKDQPPFISSSDNNSADSLFNRAMHEFSISNYFVADSLFRLAKDLDQLRFRAPEQINNTIQDVGKTYSVPIIQLDSILSFKSPGGIIGNNLMVDHLHLSLEGYQELGNQFYNKMYELNLLPDIKASYIYELQDSITRKNFNFSALDSTISDFQIKLLKNDWPFINPKKKKNVLDIISIQTETDSAAFSYVRGNNEWEDIHRSLGVHYIQNNSFEKGKELIDILISQYPLTVEYHEYLSEQLIRAQRFDDALEYLKTGNNIEDNHYFNKWLGIINLSKENIDASISYLEKSITFNDNDSQVLYNLSGAYAKKNDFLNALAIIDRCLKADPNYKAAISLRDQLINIIKQQESAE